MLQLNQYKKICHLTDSEIRKISDFFKQLCEVDKITTISVYLDERGETVCEIEGFDDPTTTVIGSFIKHDMRTETVIASAERFKEFADQYNKRLEE